MEQQWNDIDMENLKNSETCPQCHFVHHISHWTDQGANPSLHGEKLATNCLSCGMA
jgi:hypothetical protein